MSSFGGTGTTVHTGSAVIDFGDIPQAETAVEVTGQLGIALGSRVRCYIQNDVMGSNTAIDHVLAAECLRVFASIPTPDVGFTIYARSTFALWTKRFRIQWSWS